MALSETPDMLTGTKGISSSEEIPVLPASRKVVSKEDRSSCLSGGFLAFHSGPPQLGEGTLACPEMR